MAKINKFKWDAEGLPDMLFTAEYLNRVYDHCNNDCDTCMLGQHILNNSTTPCLLITKAKISITDEIRNIL